MKRFFLLLAMLLLVRGFIALPSTKPHYTYTPLPSTLCANRTQDQCDAYIWSQRP